MDDGDMLQTAGARRQIEQGLTLAQQERYDEALTHLVSARRGMGFAAPLILAKLDAFIQGHDRYCEVEHALHEASEQFATVLAEQRVRVHELQRAVSSPAPDEEPGSGPRLQPGEVTAPESAQRGDGLPVLSITCFGRFQVHRAGQVIHLCQNRNGQAILRYLAVQSDHRETIDTLMEALWPGEAPEVGRHKLYVASSALRRALNGEHARQKGTGYLLCDNGAYELNPAAHIRIDVDDYLARYRAGQRADTDAQVEQFEAACRLYTGCILPDDQYADWAIARREQLARVFLTMCMTLAGHYLATGQYRRAAEWALRILDQDRCDETAVRQLMQAYVGDGRRHEALRQYHVCRRTLSEELGVQPMPETTALYRAIVDGESLVSSH